MQEHKKDKQEATQKDNLPKRAKQLERSKRIKQKDPYNNSTYEPIWIKQGFQLNQYG